MKFLSWINHSQGGGYNPLYDVGTVGSTSTIDWAVRGLHQKLTLTTLTNLTLSFTAPPGPCWLTLIVASPAIGTVPVITWPGTVKWAGGVAPTPAATLGNANIHRLFYDGTNYYGDAIVNA